MSHRRDILFTIAILVLLYLAYLIRDVLMMVYVSALFAVVLAPAIEAVQRLRIGRWHPGRGVAVLVILGAVLAGLALFFAVALPPVFHDVEGLVENWPTHSAKLREKMQTIPFAERFDPANLQQYVSGIVGGLFGFFRKLAGGLFWVFSWLILTAYFILDGERAFRWGVSLFPAAEQPRLAATLHRAERRMRHWLVGQAALMLILGVLSLIVFGFLGLRYFYALGALAGMMNFVPIIGPLIAIVFASIVAVVDSGAKLLGVLIFFILYQQLENAYLTPRIMRTTVDLPPLAIITALAIGGTLAGIIGALVAVPTAALVAVFLDEYVVNKDPGAAPVPAR